MTESKGNMSHRERVKLSLSHKEPDRIPIDIGGTFLSSATEEFQRMLAEALCLKGERDMRFKRFDNRIQEYFDCDLRSITPARWPKWGFKEVHDAPLRDAAIEDLEKYPWPEPEDPDSIVEGLVEEAKFLRDETDYFVTASQIGQGIFEAGCWLRGYEQILVDTAIDKDFVHAFNQKVLEVNIKWGDIYFGAIGKYVDAVFVGDDLATQASPYMSPETFRELFKPYFREYIASIRKHCPNAFIGHHCCGSSFKIMDDLADIGIQVINPVQTTAKEMSPENLATKKDKLSFHGGIDLQHILPFGTKQEVRDFVKNMIEKLGSGGGYILAACHTLPEDVKVENVITMLETALEYGKY